MQCRFLVTIMHIRANRNERIEMILWHLFIYLEPGPYCIHIKYSNITLCINLYICIYIYKHCTSEIYYEQRNDWKIFSAFPNFSYCAFVI